MDRKIKSIIGIIELGLLPFLPAYSTISSPSQVQQQPSALENIIDDSNTKKSYSKLTYNYNAPTQNYFGKSYKQNLIDYLRKHIESKEDTTNRVPLKWLNILPETMMGGVLGFTYLGENFMGRRADLAGNKARMVDIHESIHTPDEYETRVLTTWIMEKVRSKYLK